MVQTSAHSALRPRARARGPRSPRGTTAGCCGGGRPLGGLGPEGSQRTPAFGEGLQAPRRPLREPVDSGGDPGTQRVGGTRPNTPVRSGTPSRASTTSTASAPPRAAFANASAGGTRSSPPEAERPVTGAGVEAGRGSSAGRRSRAPRVERRIGRRPRPSSGARRWRRRSASRHRRSPWSGGAGAFGGSGASAAGSQAAGASTTETAGSRRRRLRSASTTRTCQVSTGGSPRQERCAAGADPRGGEVTAAQRCPRLRPTFTGALIPRSADA